MTRARGARHKPSRARPGDEASVSDVLGSILLVGITVVMAAGFGAVLLSYDGPADQQHTQVNVAVTQAATGWPNALLVVTNLGGEPLLQSQFTVLYQEAGGASQSVHPTNFTNGKLVIGQSWKHPINALPGDVVPVTLVVSAAGAAQVISSASVPAGGEVNVVLTYTDGLTTTRGSASAFGNAGTGADDFAVVSEGAVGASTANPTFTGGSPTPAAVQATDSSRTSLSAAAASVQAENFNVGAPFSISNVQIGFEGRGIYPTVTRQQTVEGLGTIPATSLATASMALVTGDVVVVFVAQGNTALSIRNVALSAVSGMAWTNVATETASAGTGRLDTFVGVYTGAGTSSAITAQFSNTVSPFLPALFDRAAIEAVRYSNVDTASPVQEVSDAQAPGNGGPNFVSGSATVAGTTNPAGSANAGMFVAAVNGVASTGVSWTGSSPAVIEFVDVDVSSKVQLAVADLASLSSNSASGSVGTNQDWQSVGLTLRPKPLPTIQLTYQFTPAGTAGTTPTPLSPALSTTDAITTQDITSARGTWSSADFGATGLAVRVTVTGVTGGTVEVNRIFVTLVTTTAPATYQMDLTIDWPTPTTVPASGTHYLELRYQTNGIDTFNVLIGGTRNCGVLNSPTQVSTFTCLLTQAEADSLTVKFTDVGDTGTLQGAFNLAYARVSST